MTHSKIVDFLNVEFSSSFLNFLNSKVVKLKNEGLFFGVERQTFKKKHQQVENSKTFEHLRTFVLFSFLIFLNCLLVLCVTRMSRNTIAQYCENGLNMGCTLDKLQNASFRASILSTQNTSIQQVTLEAFLVGESGQFR